jgi:hypothetical protein
MIRRTLSHMDRLIVARLLDRALQKKSFFAWLGGEA